MRTLIVALLLSIPVALPAQKVVFAAGTPSHGYGSHEHRAGLMLLEARLRKAYPQIETVFWDRQLPASLDELDGAAALVIDCDGGNHIAKDRYDEISRFTEKGLGVVMIHYSVDRPSGEGGDQIRDWIGGNYEQNWSVNPSWTAQFRSLPDHPIARGVKPFAIHDEWYFHMRFQPEMAGVTPILSAKPGAQVLLRPDGPHNGNPAMREAVAKGEPQHVAWAYERPGGGRGFGFTGAHHHDNYRNDSFRTVLLNGIAWVAGLEIPSGGVPSERPKKKEIAANQDFPKPDDWETKQGLVLVGDGEPLFDQTAGAEPLSIELDWNERKNRHLYLVTVGDSAAAWANGKFEGGSGASVALTELSAADRRTPTGPLKTKDLRSKGRGRIAVPGSSLIHYHVPPGAERLRVVAEGEGVRFLVFDRPPAPNYVAWIQAKR